MLKNGQPDLKNAKVKALNSYIKNIWDAKAITPGAFTLKEQDKVEEFTNGRVGMMIDTLSHVTLIQKNNPKLKFNISPLPSEETNAKLAAIARAFPGNTKSVPDFVNSDAISKKAFEIYTQGYPANEFTGLPVAEELMRLYGEQFQQYLSGKISVTKLADNAQAAWLKKF